MTRRRVWIGAAVAALVLVVLAVISLTGSSGSPAAGPAATPTAASGADQARLAVPRRQAGDPLALGRVDAPVVVAEWGDFQCPFCRLFAVNTEPALLRQYVDTGRVRFEWHDYAYLGPESVLGARAARAAGRQGRFWEFHDALYRDQPRENTRGGHRGDAGRDRGPSRARRPPLPTRLRRSRHHRSRGRRPGRRQPARDQRRAQLRHRFATDLRRPAAGTFQQAVDSATATTGNQGR